MPGSSRRICFLAYNGATHYRIFQQIREAVPSGLSGEIRSLYWLTAQSLFYSSAEPKNVPPEVFDEITAYYVRKTVRVDPAIDTERWRRRVRRRAVQWFRLFLRELRNIDLLVMWTGGFAIPYASAAAAARYLGKPVAFCENGVLPGTLAIDPVGANYESSLSGKDADFYRSFPYDKEAADKLYATAWPQRPLRYGEAGQENGALPSRYILYAMQVNRDSQIRSFSPRFRNMDESVSYVHGQLQEYNRRAGDNLSLVVKEHPSESKSVDYTDLRSRLSDVTFLRATPIRDLIRDAKCLVTVNSSVGVEALFADLPVITLGQAFFNVPGLVTHLEADDELADLLPSVLSRPIDHDLRRHFLCFLWNDYLVPKPDRDPSGAARAVARLEEIRTGDLSWQRRYELLTRTTHAQQ